MNPDLKPVLSALAGIVLGKERQLKLALACLLARGHLLIEDVPGVGKTTLALALARVFGLHFQRVQFTSDLLPADILGMSIYEPGASPNPGTFRFHAGPLFSEIVLADEINRASPKTQSALLEAMEERQVTSDGITRALPDPFFVVATQNPGEQIGTYELPESQLDRFLMRLSLGYPSRDAERALLNDPERRDLLAGLSPVLSAAQLRAFQQQVKAIRTSPALIDYLIALLRATREHRTLKHGLSPRAGLALKHAAQAWALLEGRSGVIPEDLQAVFASVASHRLSAVERGDTRLIADEILAAVAIP